MPALGACEVSFRTCLPARRALAMVLPCVAIAGAVACAVVLPLAGLGYRFQWWGLRPGFAVVKWTTFAAAAAAGGVARAPVSVRRGTADPRSSVVALVVAGAVLVVPIGLVRAARQALPIHDITTDTENPPGFVAVLGSRPGATNSTDYAGSLRRRRQRGAYPDIAPADLARPPDRVFSAGGVRGDGASAGRSWPRCPPRAGSRPPTRHDGGASRTTSWFASDRRTEAAGSTCARCRGWASATSASTPSASAPSSPRFAARAARSRAPETGVEPSVSPEFPDLPSTTHRRPLWQRRSSSWARCSASCSASSDGSFPW